MRAIHRESHLIERIGWLRAAVLGANDGIISTASLVVGVGNAATDSSEVLVAGVAGLVAGAMSMAAGEYVSVSSQADTEDADMSRERRELAEQPEEELAELTQIYVQRGVEPALARQVAEQMTQKDAFAAHARDELGLAEHVVARPSRRRSRRPGPSRLARSCRWRWRSSRRPATSLGSCRADPSSASQASAHWARGSAAPNRQAHPARDLLGRACHGRHGFHRKSGRTRGVEAGVDGALAGEGPLSAVSHMSAIGVKALSKRPPRMGRFPPC